MFNAKLCLLHVVDEGLGVETAAMTLPLGLLDGVQNDARERLGKVLTGEEEKELSELRWHDRPRVRDRDRREIAGAYFPVSTS